MNKLFFLFTISVLAIGSKSMAQATYEVPKDYTLKAKEDYAKYEQDVINTVDWLQQTSWDEQPDKRKEANAFLIAWITGSPDITITVGGPLVKLTDKNPDLLITFMGGYTKYCLQHKGPADVNAANTTGLKALIDKYQAEKNHHKNKAVEKLIQIDKNGQLADYAGRDYLKP